MQASFQGTGVLRGRLLLFNSSLKIDDLIEVADFQTWICGDLTPSNCRYVQEPTVLVL